MRDIEYSLNLRIYTSFLILLLVYSCGVKRSAQLHLPANNVVLREFRFPTEKQVDSLLGIYSNNKTFVDEYLEPTLIALSYFPELKDISITFKYSKEATTMAARPILTTVFGKIRYQILINNQSNFKGILLSDVPFNAQIGIIAHELSHIVDYESRNFWGILGITFRFLDKKRKPLFEKEIDRITIERGLGWQLYDWAVFSMYESDKATEDYKTFKQKNYMTPKEIEYLISCYSKYSISSMLDPDN